MSSAVPSRARRRTLPHRLRSERLRVGLAMLTVVPVGALVIWSALVDDRDLTGSVTTLVMLSVMGIVAGGASYAAVYAGITHWTFLRLPRRELVVTARHSRTRARSTFSRWFLGRGSAMSEILSLIAFAVFGVVALLVSDDPAMRPMLLLWAIGAILATWYSSVITFAIEYTAADTHRDAFRMESTERDFEDYVYLSLLLQVSAAPSDVVPVTRKARRAVRTQSVLAHIMNTVVISLGVSVVMTAL